MSHECVGRASSLFFASMGDVAFLFCGWLTRQALPLGLSSLLLGPSGLGDLNLPLDRARRWFFSVDSSADEWEDPSTLFDAVAYA